MQSMTSNQIAAEYDAIFAACTAEAELQAVIDGIDFRGMSGALVAHITASADNAINRIRRDASKPVASQPHKHRSTVIDRAIGKGIKIEDADVRASQTLREVATDFVSTYKGFNSFVQDVAVKLATYGTLTASQMRGALNVMVAEARIERLQSTSADQFAAEANAAPYLDLRSKKDKEVEDAGEVADVDTQALTHRVPNGTYTIILNEATREYRTIRLADAPEHFNAKAGTQIASYLTGANNDSDFTGFAFVTGNFTTVWKKYRTTIDSKIVKALGMLVNSDDPIAYMREYVLRSNNCGVCGRKLTTPESIEAGIGPICRKNLEAQGFSFTLTKADRATSRQQAQSDIDELFAD